MRWLALVLLSAMAFGQATAPSPFPTGFFSSGSTTPTITNANCATGSDNGGANTMTATITPAAGEMIIVGLSSQAAGTTTISDSKSQTYTCLGPTPGGAAKHGDFCYKANAASGSTTITVTGTGFTNASMIACPVTGAATVSPVDGASGTGYNTTDNTFGHANPQTTGAISGFTSSDLLVSFFAQVQASSGMAFTIQGSFTEITHAFPTGNGGAQSMMAKYAPGSNSSISSTANSGGGAGTASEQSVGFIVAIKH